MIILAGMAQGGLDNSRSAGHETDAELTKYKHYAASFTAIVVIVSSSFQFLMGHHVISFHLLGNLRGYSHCFDPLFDGNPPRRCRIWPYFQSYVRCWGAEHGCLHPSGGKRCIMLSVSSRRHPTDVSTVKDLV